MRQLKHGVDLSPAGPTRRGVRAPGHWMWVALACLAVVVPTLIAYNDAPSATFLNQDAAFIGWGGFLVVVAAAMPADAWPRSTEALAMLAAMVLLCAAALAAPFIGSAPWSLALSTALTIASAILTIAIGAAARARGLGDELFRAFALALVVAGIASSLIGLLQVFAPTWPDGDWIALSAGPGRATGNLRQPNHLSSLLLWSVIAVLWLGEASPRWRHAAPWLAVVFIYVIVLTASRTGAVGMLTLAVWGLFDARLSRRSRAMLILAPIVYGAFWWGTSAWATYSHNLFGGQTRFGGGGDISSSRFAIWSNTLSLIAQHPWLGVGVGEFNFAWSLTPFPQRPVAFFDHTHDIVLNFAVELGLPLAALVLGLMLFALWRALRNAIDEGRIDKARVPVQRAAFVIVVMAGVHSLLEYPLWYSYFLLPASFAFGLCLERPDPRATAEAARPFLGLARPFVLLAMAMVLAALLALLDYSQVVAIFAPRGNVASLEKRIAEGQRSVLFGHHADYAAATIDDQPGKVMSAFARPTHYLLDTRLMMAWAKGLEQSGQDDKARYVAARLKEFHNPDSEAFFAPCAAASASNPATPFQCLAPRRNYSYRDFQQ